MDPKEQGPKHSYRENYESNILIFHYDIVSQNGDQ